MRSWSALYIDAGYLLASAATRVSGTSLRSAAKYDYPALIDKLIAQAESDSGLKLLRVNWYDSGNGSNSQPDDTQRGLGMMPRVKLRLGRKNTYGEQKGVDLRLGLDLVTQARNSAVDVVYLLSGDDDLSEAVEEAQSHGVQVILMAVPDVDGAPHAVAKHLQMEADGLLLISGDTIDSTVERRASPTKLSDPQASAAIKSMAAAPRTPPAQPVVAAPVPLPSAVIPKPTAIRPAPAELVYSASQHGVTDYYTGRDASADVIDDVCRGALDAWMGNADESARQQLRTARPYIPSDLDSALLRDLSARLGVYEIKESDRLALRARFWELVENLD